MKNKIILKKYLFNTLILTLVIIIVFLILNIYEYHEYTKNFNNKINSIVNVVESKYPNLTESEIIEILNKEDDGKETLKKYGINLNDKSIVIKNDIKKNQFIIINIIFLIISITILISLFLNYIKKKESSLLEITNYLKELNNKNYYLQIDSNTEDELSLLKNEIYKITVMLKEDSINSKQDKINLKKSLEDISHQLKTPLTSILIMLDNLIDNPDMDKSLKSSFISDIKRNVLKIHLFIEDILKLSKFDSNTISFNKETRLIKDIINESFYNVCPLSDLKNIKINIKGDEKITINCDFKWQVEALTNILKNSLEYSKPNSQIDISYTKNNVYSEIIIKDYGMGIKKEDMPNLFKRFYKCQNSSSDSIGIGLSLAKMIVEKDNGKISVESNKKGTKFTIKYFSL